MSTSADRSAPCGYGAGYEGGVRVGSLSGKRRSYQPPTLLLKFGMIKHDPVSGASVLWLRRVRVRIRVKLRG